MFYTVLKIDNADGEISYNFSYHAHLSYLFSSNSLTQDPVFLRQALLRLNFNVQNGS